MNRRRFLHLAAAGALLGSGAARAQKAVPVIGVLGFGRPDDPAIVANLAGLRRGLQEAGFVEGRNVAIEYRWAQGDESRLPLLAAELVADHVAVIVTEGGTPTALAAKAAPATVPVVFHASDAVADGIVANLARPGGNLTGVSLFAPELSLKQFSLLSELVPNTKAVAILAAPSDQLTRLTVHQLGELAAAKGVTLHPFSADDEGGLESAYAALTRIPVGGIVVRANSTFVDPLLSLASRYPIPAIYNQRAFPLRGGLLSYGVSIPAVYVTKGLYTAKILNGARPADLPVQQPSKFELVVNLKTAKAHGLAVPPLLLAQADEIIE